MYGAHLISFYIAVLFKGTVSLVFSLLVFSPALEYPIRTVSNFNNFGGTPLDGRVDTYIHFCLQVHFEVSAA